MFLLSSPVCLRLPLAFPLVYPAISSQSFSKVSLSVCFACFLSLQFGVFYPVISTLSPPLPLSRSTPSHDQFLFLPLLSCNLLSVCLRLPFTLPLVYPVIYSQSFSLSALSCPAISTLPFFFPLALLPRAHHITSSPLSRSLALLFCLVIFTLPLALLLVYPVIFTLSLSRSSPLLSSNL